MNHYERSFVGIEKSIDSDPIGFYIDKNQSTLTPLVWTPLVFTLISIDLLSHGERSHAY